MIRSVKIGYTGVANKFARPRIWTCLSRPRTETLGKRVHDRKLTGRGMKVLPFDHVYNPSSDVDSVVVLYADIQAETFAVFHQELKKLADEGKVRYIFRYRPPISSSSSGNQKKPLFLSGYGVELMLKKTDYIVIDDRDVEAGIRSYCTPLTPEHSDREDKPETVEPNTKAPPSDDEEVPVITPLYTSDLKYMGYQAVQLITSSSSPLNTLCHLSQDFPSQSAKIASVPINETLLDTLRENAKVIPGGENIFWMNGMHIPEHKVEAFNLLSVMRRERNLISSLRKLGLTNREAVDFLSHEKIAEKIEVGTMNRFDFRDDVEGGNVVIWLNDLENDSRYLSWPTDIRNVHPTQLVAFC